MPWRISGSWRTSTVSNATPRWSRMATARLEKPHCGKRAVPFMNRTTSFEFTISSAAIAIGSALGRHELAPCLDRLVGERLADLGLVALDAGGGEVAEQLADHVLVAGFLEIGPDHVLGVGVRLGLRQPHQPRRPAAEQPVAPRHDPELHLLVAGIFGFERPLAIVERGHLRSLASLWSQIGRGEHRINRARRPAYPRPCARPC